MRCETAGKIKDGVTPPGRGNQVLGERIRDEIEQLGWDDLWCIPLGDRMVSEGSRLCLHRQSSSRQAHGSRSGKSGVARGG